MRDGVRLATVHVWPVDGADGAPTVVVRTPYGVRSGLGLTVLAGRLIAESGYHVIVQDVRGRYRSEGLFTPFANERADGGDTLEWVVTQPWCDGRIGLFGASYPGYSAWAALSAAPEHVAAMSVAIGSGDLYPIFYRGGAFALSIALEWGVGVGERENVPRGKMDLERGLAYRPVREADRVALRVVDWYRDWVDHPRRDDFWHSIRPQLPEGVPPTLLIAGWHDFFLPSQLADYAALLSRGETGENESPHLLIGPWAHGLPARIRWWRWEMLSAVLRETIRHFDAHLRRDGGAASHSHVRYFVAGAERWRESSTWPPARADTRRLHLCRRQESLSLCWNAPRTDEEPARYEHDPADPVPTIGGALFGLKGGSRDQRALDRRADLLVYRGSVLEEDLEIAGEVRLVLHASSSAADADFAVKLTDAAPNGRAFNVCDGIIRCRWRGKRSEESDPSPLEPGEAMRLEIDLGACACVFRAGHRIRLEVASSNFPRFERNPGGPAAAGATDDDCPSWQTILHDSEHPSYLLLPVVSR